MSKTITPFFATEHDLAGILSDIDVERPIKVVAGGVFDTPTVQVASISTKLNPSMTYLIADQGALIEVRAVPQRDGCRKFAIDQLDNPKTVALRAGGFIERCCLVAGQIGTSTNDPISLELYKYIAKRMKKLFVKVKSYYLGREAAQLLDEGIRLTANPKAPLIYDLSRN